DRPLSPLEVRALTQAVDQLNAQATAEYRADRRINAYKIWNRELRLRRVLGPLVETKALGRVGAIAWEDSETPQLRLITNRLQAIQQQTRTRPLPTRQEQILLQRALADAYLKVRSKDRAVGVYEQVITDARPLKDLVMEGSALATIADLHLNWFAYPTAATSYQTLLAFLRQHPKVPVRLIVPVSEAAPPQPTTPDPPLTDRDVLKKLAFVYDQDKRPAQAIPVRQELIRLLQQRQEPMEIPSLQLAIGISHEALQQIPQAIEAYQQTYYLSQPLQQYGYASDALKRLGNLYQNQKQFDRALQIYEFLLDVEQQAYNFYGRMMTYDQIGQIYLLQREFDLALGAFQQGLTIARQLKYRENYFQSQINQVQQQRSGK
ncbi:MAG: tetratricopeptide repeat protein, partial [Leptolyngbyaceae cyanobacterium bins.59]|nr:tetratricopeptide repeat protein [Leptolyngbyaceae cyanobacterium bins.59]